MANKPAVGLLIYFKIGRKLGIDFCKLGASIGLRNSELLGRVKAMARTTAEIKANAIKVLGEARVTELLSASIVEAHKLYSATYDKFRDEEARAYSDIILLKNLGVK